MRSLRKLKIMYSEKKGTSYRIDWSESSGDMDVWEHHVLESGDCPRPELKKAIENMAFFLVDLCEIEMPAEEIQDHVSITSIVIDEKKARMVSISGDVLLMNGYSIKLNGPSCLCPVDGNALDKALDVLTQECFRYVDGNRAQMKLFVPNDDEDKEGEDDEETVPPQTES